MFAMWILICTLVVVQFNKCLLCKCASSVGGSEEGIFRRCRRVGGILYRLNCVCNDMTSCVWPTLPYCNLAVSVLWQPYYQARGSFEVISSSG